MENHYKFLTQCHCLDNLTLRELVLENRIASFSLLFLFHRILSTDQEDPIQTSHRRLKCSRIKVGQNQNLVSKLRNDF